MIQAGDRVKIVGRKPEGATGVVERFITTDSLWPYRVKLDREGEEFVGLFAGHEVVSVVPDVGDRVRIVRGESSNDKSFHLMAGYNDSYPEGQLGTVSAVYTPQDGSEAKFPYMVNMGNRQSPFFAKDELVVVSEDVYAEAMENNKKEEKEMPEQDVKKIAEQVTESVERIVSSLKRMDKTTGTPLESLMGAISEKMPELGKDWESLFGKTEVTAEETETVDKVAEYLSSDGALEALRKKLEVKEKKIVKGQIVGYSDAPGIEYRVLGRESSHKSALVIAERLDNGKIRKLSVGKVAVLREAPALPKDLREEADVRVRTVKEARKLRAGTRLVTSQGEKTIKSATRKVPSRDVWTLTFEGGGTTRFNGDQLVVVSEHRIVF